MFKKNYFVKSIIFSFVLLSVIIFSCDKKNIIEDDLNVCIKSFELLNSENEGKNLGSNIDCEIDAENYIISLTVPHTAVLDGLKFNITPCEGTTISPASGEEINFEAVVEEATNEDVSEGAAEETTKKPSTQRYKKVFTLTKEGKSQKYTVYITKVLASDCSISSFKLEKSKNETKIFADREGVITESTDTDPSTITLHVSESAILDGLTPTIVHTGTTFSSESPVSTTDSGTSITTTTVNCTVTAADGETTKVYVVKYIKDLSSDNKISTFAFTKDNTNNTGLKLTRSSTAEGRTGDVEINDTNGTIKVKVSTAADVAALIPTITKHERATISPAEDVHDYSTNNGTKVYTITAQDGQTKQYTVSVAKDLSNNKNMTSFKFEYTQNTDKSFNSQDYDGTINNPSSEEDGTVTIAKMPHTITNLTGLKPSIVLSNSNATVSPGNGIAQDFTRGEEKIYTVTAQDGTTRKYKVTIGELSAAADITSFIIKKSDHTTPNEVRMTGSEVSGVISNSGSNHTITISLDGEGDDSINLKPAIEFSAGATVNPASGAGTEFTYGTAQTYTVTAENGSQKTYQVTVKSSNSKMKSFGFKKDTGNNSSKKIVQDVTGTIDHVAKTVTVNVPYNADVTALTPEIVLYNGASVSPEATTAQNFSDSNTVKYTVTAQDGTTSDYNVTVTQNAAPQIETFKFTTASNNSKNLGSTDIIGEITHNSGDTPGEIIVKVPHDAEIGELTPTVTTSSGATVYKGTATEAANTSNNFDNSQSTPKEYSVVDSAGGRKVYEVKVYKEPAITEFKFEKSANSDTGFPAGKTYTAESAAITQGNLLQNGTISITVANTINVTNLKATISGNNINPSTTTIDTSFTSTSGTSTYSTTITVANQYLSDFTKTYTVNLTKEAAPQLTEFKITANTNKGIAAEVGATFTHPTSTGNTGTIKLKFHKNNEHVFDLTGLTPTITSPQGCTVSPASDAAVTGEINNQQFTLTKTDTGSKRVYTVEAVKGPYISKFEFKKDTTGNTGKNLGDADIDGTIDHAQNTIKLEVPSGVTMDSGGNTVTITPTIEVGGDNANVEPASLTPKEFTVDNSTTVDYTVTGADGMIKTYKITVSKASSSG
ncbi:DUF5018 domain-containing protein [Ichthyobacterium seriolicida]|uniref:Pkd domain containing protein n=1 Tax=Ichthyobacterium seriolicida TaxID=242600 RepID=A0A1J1EAU0_9FLAO|nr:hypothetical protein [Ichthyobacterium seriolicida]BAV94632.1 pkd domain containing protein [Ichthyobacterium seriolicida]